MDYSEYFGEDIPDYKMREMIDRQARGSLVSDSKYQLKASTEDYDILEKKKYSASKVVTSYKELRDLDPVLMYGKRDGIIGEFEARLIDDFEAREYKTIFRIPFKENDIDYNKPMNLEYDDLEKKSEDILKKSNFYEKTDNNGNYYIESDIPEEYRVKTLSVNEALMTRYHGTDEFIIHDSSINVKSENNKLGVEVDTKYLDSGEFDPLVLDYIDSLGKNLKFDPETGKELLKVNVFESDAKMEEIKMKLQKSTEKMYNGLSDMFRKFEVIHLEQKTGLGNVLKNLEQRERYY